MATNGNSVDLSPADRKKLPGPTIGSAFDPYERLFGSFDGGTVFDYTAQYEARDMRDMLARDGQARSLEQVLTLPLRSADWKITNPASGDQGQAGMCRDVLAEKLDLLLDQMTAAVTYRKAFFETTWRLDGGHVVYDEILWRPPASCDAGFDPATGRPDGFRQRVWPINGKLPPGASGKGLPGYAYIPARRAFVYTHGTHRDPLRGISDLDVAYWASETKQKILFLWFQFLENQALPKLAVYGDSLPQAEETAQGFAGLKSSGVLPMARPSDPQAKAFELIESAGHGHQQFQAAITYLDSMMTSSVLAGFTDLPQAAVQGTGSYALSADQSEFFLASRQAVADEMAGAIRRDLFGPLVAYNYGPDAVVPKLEIGPLSSKYVQRATTLLGETIRSRYSGLPRDVTYMLIEATGTYLGLDHERLLKAIDADMLLVAQQEAEAQAAGVAPQPQFNPLGPFGIPAAKPVHPPAAAPTTPAAAPAQAVKLAHTVDTLHELVQRSQAGQDPRDALADMLGP